MSKTAEELAQQYISTIADTHSVKAACEKAFLAGYKAARDHNADVSKVMPDTCEHILDMEKMVDVNGWISVKERMPEKNSELLLLMCVDGYELGYYERYTSYGWTNVLGTDCLNVTHWQELPEPPKEQK